MTNYTIAERNFFKFLKNNATFCKIIYKYSKFTKLHKREQNFKRYKKKSNWPNYVKIEKNFPIYVKLDLLKRSRFPISESKTEIWIYKLFDWIIFFSNILFSKILNKNVFKISNLQRFAFKKCIIKHFWISSIFWLF